MVKPKLTAKFKNCKVRTLQFSERAKFAMARPPRRTLQFSERTNCAMARPHASQPKTSWPERLPPGNRVARTLSEKARAAMRTREAERLWATCSSPRRVLNRKVGRLVTRLRGIFYRMLYRKPCKEATVHTLGRRTPRARRRASPVVRWSTTDDDHLPSLRALPFRTRSQPRSGRGLSWDNVGRMQHNASVHQCIGASGLELERVSVTVTRDRDP